MENYDQYWKLKSKEINEKKKYRSRNGNWLGGDK